MVVVAAEAADELRAGPGTVGGVLAIEVGHPALEARQRPGGETGRIVAGARAFVARGPGRRSP